MSEVEYLLIFLVIVIIIMWFFSGKHSMDKEIKKAFEKVVKGKPISTDASITEVVMYCEKNHIDFYFVAGGLVVTYNEKTVSVKQDSKNGNNCKNATSTNDILGGTIFYI